MKQNIRIILVFGAIFMLGASLSAGFRFCYTQSIIYDFPKGLHNQMSWHDYLNLIAILLKPMVITWLCGFTIFGCFSAGANCLLHGVYLGDLLIRYCRSDFSPFTHIGMLILLLVFLMIDCLFSVDICRCRGNLKTVIPNPADLIKQNCVRRMSEHFLTGSAVIISFGSALYLLLIYFPL